MKDKIYLLEPSANPLTLLTAKMGKMVAKNPKFDWLEDEAMPISDTLATTFVTATTDILATDGTKFAVNQVIKFTETGETALVTAVATNTLTITRSWGGTVAGSVAGGGTILILGNTAAENATAETSREVKVANAYNYTEITRTPFGVSRTANESEMYGGNILAYLHKARGIDHAKSLELKLLWGERAEVDGTTTITRSTGGLYELISTNSTDFSTTLTPGEIETASVTDFRYGSSTKVCFCSRAVASIISKVALGNIRVEPAEKTYGLNIRRYITTGGEYLIIPHDLFVGGDYDEIAIIADLEMLAYRFLRNSDTKLRTNIQAPDADGRKDEYLTEMGLERKLEKTHAKWLNIEAYAAS
jgi:hypothetical protein